MWKISFPPDVVVSIELGDALEADLLFVEACDRLDEVLEGAAEPVQVPDNEGVALPDVVEGFVQTYPLCLCSGGRVGEDPAAACLSRASF